MRQPMARRLGRTVHGKLILARSDALNACREGEAEAGEEEEEEDE